MDGGGRLDHQLLAVAIALVHVHLRLIDLSLAATEGEPVAAAVISAILFLAVNPEGAKGSAYADASVLRLCCGCRFRLAHC